MSKALRITVKSEGTVGRVDIIGSISEWNQNNAIELREKAQAVKDSGATQGFMYVMTVGGDCFQANEIANIMDEVFGSYEGEGGAIVASAGTYLAVRATKFTLAKNTQFMIHKPMGGTHGNETEIENYLQLIKNMTGTYYDQYKIKLKKPETEFKAKWNAGDFWMTAAEAQEWGFVDAVKEPQKLDAKALDANIVDAIKASGSPIAIATEDIIHLSSNTMNLELQATAVLVGLEASATVEQVQARLASLNTKAKAYDTLSAKVAQEKKDKQEAEIKAKLDLAEKNKVFKADARSKWAAMMDKDFEGTCALLEGLQGVEKPLSSGVKPSVKGALYMGKTFEQWQDEDPEALAAIEDESPEAFEALFADYKKRNKI